MDEVLGTLNKILIATSKHQELVSEYETLRADEERIKFTLDVMSKYKIFPKEQCDSKDAKQSEKFRQEGNRLFVSTPLTNNTCVEVHKLYTKSVAYAPCPSQNLALAYANRSAILVKLHKYEMSLQDIDRALTLTCPDNVRAKLCVRKIECLNALRDPKVKNSIEEARCSLEGLCLDDTLRKKFIEQLDSMKMARNVRKRGDLKQPPVPEINNRNVEVPCASDAVRIEYNEEYGRHVVATRDIKPGEVVVVEKPYSLMLTYENVYSHCSNCLEVSWANIPCDHCTFSMYCSEDCKTTHWKKYHDIECAVFPFVWKMDSSNLDLCSVRLTIQAVREFASIEELRKELIQVDNCDDPRTKGFSNDGIFASDKYRSVLSLVTNTEKRSVRDLFRRSLDSCFILWYLATRTNLFGNLLERDLSALTDNNDAVFVGSLVLRHQQLIPSNGHTFTEERGLEEAARRGFGIMPFLSLMNHSCSPNISRDCTSKHIVVRAMYPIKRGEQLFENYGPHFALTPKDARQTELLKQYYFKCNCIPCQEDWPLYYNLKSYKELAKTKADEAKISHVLRKFGAYVDLAMVGDMLDKHVVDDLLKMIQVIHDLVPMPCEEMSHVVETLKRVYGLNGNRYDVPKL
ncbi:SET and MYND domain-containing protein 4-like [Ceratina calcarata]|uniref:Protein-lysine N-methyltransferase SMYD4 n=1 Tax=Ceratina calcarata TaxID=156304 RepID=A0AAJ7NAD3_9HYME|nr:SET and MYND domain-containing protein 4-like [Ceratina calcarata]